MASRILWVALAGLALIAGMVIQDRDWIFGSMEHDFKTERAIEASVERAVERSIDRGIDNMEVMGSDGREIDATPEAKRALAEAVGRLVKAKADLAILRISDSSAEEIQAAETLADQARADVDRLKAQIERQEGAATSDRDAVREQIHREVREDIRATVREAVRN